MNCESELLFQWNVRKGIPLPIKSEPKIQKELIGIFPQDLCSLNLIEMFHLE